jgi:hypothetical protein
MLQSRAPLLLGLDLLLFEPRRELLVPLRRRIVKVLAVELRIRLLLAPRFEKRFERRRDGVVLSLRIDEDGRGRSVGVRPQRELGSLPKRHEDAGRGGDRLVRLLRESPSRRATAING